MLKKAISWWYKFKLVNSNQTILLKFIFYNTIVLDRRLTGTLSATSSEISGAGNHVQSSLNV